MNKIIKYTVILAMMFFMLSITLAPVLANEKQSFTFTTISYRDPANPGTQFTKDNILHARDAGKIGTVMGAPWGTVNQIQTQNFELNLTSFTGTGVGKGMNTGAISQIKTSLTFEFNGIITYTYHGPSFTATTNTGGTFVVVDGTKFLGLSITGQVVGQGTIDGKNIQTRGTFSGVSISTSPTVPSALTHGLAGDSIITGVTTYWYTEPTS